MLLENHLTLCLNDVGLSFKHHTITYPGSAYHFTLHLSESFLWLGKTLAYSTRAGFFFFLAQFKQCFPTTWDSIIQRRDVLEKWILVLQYESSWHISKNVPNPWTIGKCWSHQSKKLHIFHRPRRSSEGCLEVQSRACLLISLFPEVFPQTPHLLQTQLFRPEITVPCPP